MSTRQKKGKRDGAAPRSKTREPLSEKNMSTESIRGRILETLDSRYEVGVLLSKSESAMLFKGKRVGDEGKTVAIKLFKEPDHLKDFEVDELRKRFARHAQLLVRVNHPNVIRALDFAFEQHNPFLVMEHHPGKDLGVVAAQKGTLPWRWLGPVMAKVCEGLDFIHRNHIVHRGITLSNIMVTIKEGKKLKPAKDIKIVDFDLAKQMDVYYYTGMKFIQAGVMAGPADYLAPEQILKTVDGHTFDHRVDIYMMGVAMYKALTGSHPFPAEIEGLLKRLTEMPPPPSSLNPDITPDVDAIVMKALATKPEDRFSTALDMRSAIENSLVIDTPQPKKSGVKKTIMAIAIAAAVAVGGITYTYSAQIKHKVHQLFGKKSKEKEKAPVKKGFVVKIKSKPSDLPTFHFTTVKKKVGGWMKNVDKERYLGNTPIAVPLPPGTHKIRVRKKWSVPITVKVNEKNTQCTISFYGRYGECK